MYRTVEPNFGPGKLPRPGDVKRVISLATQNIRPDLFYSEEMLDAYLDRNPGALRCIRGDKINTDRITAYYILLALSEQAEGLIRDGSIDVGVALAPSLTEENPANAQAFYVGMVHGARGIHETEASLALLEHLHQLHEESKTSVRLYARRGHESSKQLMSQIGFKTPQSERQKIEEAEYPTPLAISNLKRRREWQRRMVQSLN